MANVSLTTMDRRRNDLYDELKKLTQKLGRGAKLPTIREIMASHRVSQSTVTHVISRLSEQGIVERRDRSGIYVLNSIESGKILILCEPKLFMNGSPFWPRLLSELIEPYSDDPSRVVVRFLNPLTSESQDPNPESLIPDGLLEMVSHGIFECVVLIGGSNTTVLKLQSMDIPVVSFAGSAKYQVAVATLEACQLGIEELVRLGCRRIGLFNIPTLPMREVMMAAMDRFGAKEMFMPFESSGTHVPNSISNFYSAIQSGFNSGTKMFELSHLPDGVVLIDDQFALGFLMGIVHAGHIPGDDFEIVSHSNRTSPVLLGWEDKITRIEVDNSHISKAIHAAVEALSKGCHPTTMGWDRSFWDPFNNVGGSHVLLLRSQLIPRAPK